MTKRATLRELKQDEATAKRLVRKLFRQIEEADNWEAACAVAGMWWDAKAMLRNISQAIKRREKEKRA